jgi:hypothetical protein
MEIVFEILFVSLLLMQRACAAASIDKETHIVNITRHHKGDVLIIKDVPECNQFTCLKMTNGSAFTVRDIKGAPPPENECKCQCDTRSKTYREDFGSCVDTIRGED